MKQKQNLPKRERVLTIALLIVMTVMFLATMLSLFYFRIQMREVNRQGGEGERTYDKHYALIVDDPDDPMWDSVFEQMRVVGEEKNAYVELSLIHI